MVKPTKNWLRIQPIYKYFASDLDNVDFSDQAAIDAYLWESRGIDNF
jgi:hypothetical protein